MSSSSSSVAGPVPDQAVTEVTSPAVSTTKPTTLELAKKAKAEREEREKIRLAEDKIRREKLDKLKQDVQPLMVQIEENRRKVIAITEETDGLQIQLRKTISENRSSEKYQIPYKKEQIVSINAGGKGLNCIVKEMRVFDENKAAYVLAIPTTDLGELRLEMLLNYDSPTTSFITYQIVGAEHIPVKGVRLL